MAGFKSALTFWKPLRQLFFRKELTEDCERASDAPQEFRFRRATAQEAQSWPDYFDSWDTREQVLRDLARGHRLFIAETAAGEIVGFRWMHYGASVMPVARIACPLPADTVHCVTGYVRPPWRRHGISKGIYAEMMRWATGAGYRWMMSECVSTNAISLRTYDSVGFEPYATADLWKLGFMRLIRVRRKGGRGEWFFKMSARPCLKLGEALFSP